MNLKRKKDQNTLILICVFSAITIVFLIYYGITASKYKNYDYLKENKSKALVYTNQKKESGYYNQYIPYLNIDDDLGILINNNIREYLNNFKNKNTAITYEYNVSGKILSIIIKIEDHSIADSGALLYFTSYNINLKNEEILTNDQIIEYFDTTESEIELVLNEKIENYYNKLVENNIVKVSECDYSCFLKSRDFSDDMNDISYYIDKGKLVAYKPHVFIALSDKDKIKYGFTLTK